MELKSKKIYLAGHNGMVGSAIMRELEKSGYDNIIKRSLDVLDLRNQADVNNLFESEKPEIVIIAAAKVGGILANNIYRAEFLYDNLIIEANLIHASYLNKAEKVIFLGSSCIYPKLAPQPLKEEYLLSDYLEYTNEPYAIAKIAGIKLCESYYKQYGCNFLSLMPTNLYGYNDNFNLETSHVLPALMRKFHEAAKIGKKIDELSSEEDENNSVKGKVEIWGSGTPKREFLFVDDLAEAVRFTLENIEAKDLYDLGISQLNVGSGEDITIKDLAMTIKEITGFEGEIVFDSTKPDGTPRKLMDVTRINSLGWKHKTSLYEGIKKTYEWFQKQNLKPI